MLFNRIAHLLAGNAAITLLITGSAEAMTVTLMPKPVKTGDGREALATPMVLTGTADELDAGFCDLVEKFANKRKTLAEQFEATDAVLEAAKKASTEKAAKAVTKTAKTIAKPSVAAADPSDDDDEAGSETGNANGAEKSVPQDSSLTPSSNLFA